MKIFTPKFSLKEEADITRKLSMYISAQLSLSDALQLIEEETENKRHRRTFATWRLGIEEGKSLAMVFDLSETIGVSAVTKTAAALGEKSASLGNSLKTAGEHIHKSLVLRKKVISALAYPFLILIGTSGLVLGLLLFVFPKIIPLFVSLKVPLPFSTRILIALTSLIQKHWLVLVGAVVLSVGGVLCAYRFSIRVQKTCQYVLIRIPFIGSIYRTKIVVEIFDSLFTLISGGEALDAALIQISDVVKCSEYKEILKQASEAVTQGRSLGEFCKAQKVLFPRFISGLLLVGERTGNIQNSIQNIADIMHSEIEDRLRVLTAAIEPMLMVTMSLVIGFIALSIILPIYGITSHFQNV